MRISHKWFYKPFLFFILYSFLVFSIPEGVECSETYPDELLDLLGIPTKSAASSTILKHPLPACFFSNFSPQTHSMQRHQTENLRLQPFTSELILSATLRC
jgi:hypothetical protein